jgi:hypothetical protein
VSDPIKKDINLHPASIVNSIHAKKKIVRDIFFFFVFCRVPTAIDSLSDSGELSEPESSGEEEDEEGENEEERFHLVPEKPGRRNCPRERGSDYSSTLAA